MTQSIQLQLVCGKWRPGVGALGRYDWREAVHGIKQHQSPRAGRGPFSGCGKIAPWEGGVLYKTTEYYKCNHIGFD
jgi:hypothetical protein